jgi:hypothetical protein
LDSFTTLSDPASSVCHRAFSYVNSTPATRRAFIALFRRSFLDRTGVAGDSNDGASSAIAGAATASSSLADACLGAEEVHQLCGLLCVDFPFSLVRNAARITNEPPSASSTAASEGTVTAGPKQQTTPPLRQFAHKLFVLFLFSEFLNQCALAFRALDTAGTGRVARARFHRRIVAVVEQQQQQQQQRLRQTSGAGGGAESGRDSARSSPASAVFFSCPPRAALDDALRSTSSDDTDADGSVMFNTFCVSLFAHPLVARALLAAHEDED